MSAVWIRRCASLEEALVVDALLKARGFHSELANYNYASVDWSLIPALGGVQIMVPGSEFEPAKSMLIGAAESGQAELEAQFGSYDQPISQRRWRAWSMLAIWFDLLVLPVIPLAIVFDRLVTLPALPYGYYPPTAQQQWGNDGISGWAANIDPVAFVYLLALGVLVVMELVWAYERRAAGGEDVEQ